MQFAFAFVFVLLPIGIFHLLNIFFFKKSNNFIFYKYFISYTIFYGLVGWLFFFITYFEKVNYILINLSLVIFVLISIILFFKYKYFQYLIFEFNKIKFDIKFCLIFSLSLLVLFGDYLESIAPLTNYDTLAYHLPIPEKIIEENKLIIPQRALTGYQPLLAHMNFIPLLILGGEKLLRCFFFTSEILIFILAFKYFNKKFDINLSLLLSLVVITIPVFIYSAGNGNIEIINILHLLSLFVYFELKKNNETEDIYHFIPSILIGFYAASKLFGILFFGAYFLFLIIIKKKIKEILFFLICFSIISFQWYLLIFFETGTPLFPIFYELIGLNDLPFWNIEQNNFFKDQIRNADGGLYYKIKNLIIYPFNIFIFPLDKYGGIQLSYGILFIFSFPIFFYYLYKTKFSIIKKNFKKQIYLQIFLIFYFFWYFLGSTLYFRYLLPTLYPIILFHISWYVRTLTIKKYNFLLNISLFLVLAMQISISLLHNFNYSSYVLKNETKEDFYSRNVPYYGAIAWVNNNIDTNDQILTDIRAFRYLSKNNILVIQPLLQSLINISTNTSKTNLFFEQIKKQKVKYVIKKGKGLFENNKSSSSYNYHLSVLIKKECLIKIKDLQVNDFGSRTKNAFLQEQNNFMIEIYKVNYLQCFF